MSAKRDVFVLIKTAFDTPSTEWIEYECTKILINGIYNICVLWFFSHSNGYLYMYMSENLVRVSNDRAGKQNMHMPNMKTNRKCPPYWISMQMH